MHLFIFRFLFREGINSYLALSFLFHLRRIDLLIAFRAVSLEINRRGYIRRAQLLKIAAAAPFLRRSLHS